MKQVGSYKISNLGDDATLIDQIRIEHCDGILIIKFVTSTLPNSVSTFAIDPFSETEGALMGVGRYAGDTIRLVMVDGEERLFFDGYEFSKKKDNFTLMVFRGFIHFR